MRPSREAIGGRARRDWGRWVGLGILAAPGLLISLDFSVLTLAVPKLSEALHPTATELLWMVDVYGFVLAGFLVTMGSLGDRVGRRRLLLGGASAFGAASVLTAYSTGPVMFIAGRAVLGIAGATLLPSTLALISAMFPDERERHTAIALWSISLPVGGALGPLVGGALLNWFWWGAAFLIGVPVMAVLVIAGPFLLPESRDPSGRLPDLASVGLSLAAVVPIVYGLQEIATGAAAALPIASVVVGLVSAVGFVARQHRLEDPLVEVQLFRIPAFSAALAANLFSYFVILGVLMLFAQYLQLVIGLTALRAGLWTMPAMGGLIAGSLLTPAMARRAQPAAVISAGLLTATIGFALLSRVSSSGGLPVAVTGTAIVALGLAPVTTLVVNIVLAVAPPERAGSASGLSETSTELGGALGIAVLGTLATAVYRSRLTNRLPAGIGVAGRQTARNTLGGAIDVAHRLPTQAGDTLITAARHAFRDAVGITAITSAAIVVILAVATVVTLRGAPIPVGDDLDAGTEGTGPEGPSLTRPRAALKGDPDMLLDRKVAVVYGAAGAIGSAVANAYAREGADVHLAGRTPETLEPIAAAIRDRGGLAHIAPVDTIDPTAMRDHADAVAASSGRIDICFNATSNDDLQGIPLVDINFADFMRPVTKAVTSQFNIAAAAAPHMMREGRGVILAMAGGREAIPNLGGSHVAWTALAGLCRQLAAELGPHGIRVAWVLSPGSPDGNDQPQNGGNAPETGGLLARHSPAYADVANVAAFAASDWAKTMTATELNITGGAVID